MLTQACKGHDEEEIESFLGQLSALAGSSLSGALQTTFGRLESGLCYSRVYNNLGQLTSQDVPLAATHVMVSRFERPAQLRAFLELPPCLALGSDMEGIVPLKTIQSFQIKIAPAESTRTSQPMSHRLPKA